MNAATPSIVARLSQALPGNWTVEQCVTRDAYFITYTTTKEERKHYSLTIPAVEMATPDELTANICHRVKRAMLKSEGISETSFAIKKLKGEL